MGTFRIAVVAPGGRIDKEVEARVQALAASVYPRSELEIHFHPQCFDLSGHFAGTDAVRAAAVIEAANDPAFGAVWFARGGYGACRIAEPVLAGLGDSARDKTYLGYSDTGVLLGGLYKAGVGHPAHGPMPVEITHAGGETAILRALAWLKAQDPATLEPSVGAGPPTLAYNIAVFGSVLGTPLEPPLKDHVLMLEEVGEYLYRVDRYLFQITSSAAVRQVAGIRMGRIGEAANDRPFGADAAAVVQYWCERSGIPFLGAADIGHDGENKIVPFGP